MANGARRDGYLTAFSQLLRDANAGSGFPRYGINGKLLDELCFYFRANTIILLLPLALVH